MASEPLISRQVTGMIGAMMWTISGVAAVGSGSGIVIAQILDENNSFSPIELGLLGVFLAFATWAFRHAQTLISTYRDDATQKRLELEEERLAAIERRRLIEQEREAHDLSREQWRLATRSQDDERHLLMLKITELENGLAVLTSQRDGAVEKAASLERLGLKDRRLNSLRPHEQHDTGEIPVIDPSSDPV